MVIESMPPSARLRGTSGLGRLLAVGLTLVLVACGGNSGGGGSSGGRSQGGNGTFSNDKEFFAARVEPSLGFCRSCHVPGGVADTDAGKRFLLSTNSAEDYTRLFGSWESLGKGVDSNRLLTKPSNTDAEPHSGGAPWPKDGPAYNDMKILLSCWDNPTGCAALLASAGGGAAPELPPLLGDLAATGGRNYARAFCEGQPDSAVLPEDPRHLWKGDNVRNDHYATYFSGEFVTCKNDTLYKNQANENAARVAQGKQPIHTANPPPTTCGEWRRAVKSGLDWVTSVPTTAGLFDPLTISVLIAANGGALPKDPAAANAFSKSFLMQRYGGTPTPDPARNPFPLPGEDPNATNGGSGHLPLAFAQERDKTGRWTGKLGFSCLTCHAGALGSGEVGNSLFEGGNPDGSWTGLPNSNNDYGVMLWEAQQIAAKQGRFFDATVLPNPGYVINTTRGSHAADNDVVQMFFARDVNSLEYRGPVEIYEQLAAAFTAGSLLNGDQDPPAWWWYHNKARYLWMGLLSTDATRGDMFFGAINSRSGEDIKADEHYFDDLNVYVDSMEAPRYPYGFCSGAQGTPTAGDKPGCISRPLAEQGAVLFHEKNLWANGQNSDIPTPKGNGSCAGCHGTYSPRYANDKRFLPDPRLVGMTNYNVPMEILGTDPAYLAGPLAQLLAGGPNAYSGASAAPISIWWGYPDSVEGYQAPDVSPVPPMGIGGTAPMCVTSEGGIETPPLHGVWGSAPYFHGGSVPSVWDVLKPSERPKYWLRQRVPESMAAPVTGDRGFDNRLEAYDFDKLGWKYEAYKSCDEVKARLGVDCQSAPTSNPLLTFLETLRSLGLPLGPQTVLTQAPLGKDAVLQRELYDTTLFSKGNQGHEWTQVLTDPERRALIEYLKTL